MKIAGPVLIAGVVILAACGGRREEPSSSRAEGGIRWGASITGGMSRARSDGKPLMIDFYASWCGACRLMESTTYRERRVMELAERFVPVKVDTMKNRAAASKYRINALPTIIFMDDRGTILRTVIGYRPPGGFLAEMREALAKAGAKRTP